MNFDYSDAQKALKDSIRQMLDRNYSTKSTRKVLDRGALYDRDLWRTLGENGWLSAAIPTEYGGLGLDYVSLCGIIEEFGRVILPVPLDSSIYFGAETILAVGSDEQKRTMLPSIATGELIATVALVESAGPITEAQIGARFDGNRLTGEKVAVADGMLADIAITAARDTSGEVRLYVIRLDGEGVNREAMDSVDPTRPLARISLKDAPAELLGTGKAGWQTIETVLNRAAILTAFEQLGGADRCLELARDYALTRHVFGRPIGAYQAIKHKLAETFIAAELARSAAYFGAWALASGTDAQQAEAAAVARISCSNAFEQSAREYIQVSGGIAITWEHDAHLYYRRSRRLSLLLDANPAWSDKLIRLLDVSSAA